MMKRSEVETYTLYLEASSGQYFATPGGEGVVWYETLEEAETETGLTFLHRNTCETLRDY